jgi:8-oxo-dGTP pyrophosphatase MutT (NUDIX family)
MDETSVEDIESKTAAVERSLLTRARLKLQRPILRWMRSMTMGARTAVIDENGRFLLVKHTYSPGWIFPGGGIESGESAVESAIREIREEANVVAKGELQLHGVFSNHREMLDDHLIFYVLRSFEVLPFKPNSEIADARFFTVEELPATVTGGSRRRIAELTGHAPISREW